MIDIEKFSASRNIPSTNLDLKPSVLLAFFQDKKKYIVSKASSPLPLAVRPVCYSQRVIAFYKYFSSENGTTTTAAVRLQAKVRLKSFGSFSGCLTMGFRERNTICIKELITKYLERLR